MPQKTKKKRAVKEFIDLLKISLNECHDFYSAGIPPEYLTALGKSDIASRDQMESNRGSELVNCIAMDIPTSPARTAVWLCLHPLFKLASVLMGSWGTGPCPRDAGQVQLLQLWPWLEPDPAKPGSSLCWLWCMCAVPEARVRCWGSLTEGTVLCCRVSWSFPCM